VGGGVCAHPIAKRLRLASASKGATESLTSRIVPTAHAAGTSYVSPIMPKTLRVDIWSDIVCPWCYVGKRRFEAALAQFPHHDAVAVTWRAFELDPSAPRLADPSVSLAQGLARKYGMPLPQADGMLVKMTETAAAEGLDFHFEKARRGNTFDAHRVLHLAGERGVQDAVKERLMRGYFTEGAAVSDPEVLATLGAEAGLDADEVRTVLAAETYAAEVRADEGTARELGITGVPFFVIAGRFGISGAQPATALLEALDRAWKEAKDEPALEAQEGAACGPAGCATG